MRIRVLIAALVAFVSMWAAPAPADAATKKSPAKKTTSSKTAVKKTSTPKKAATVKKTVAPAKKTSTAKKSTVKKASTTTKKKAPAVKKARVVVPKRPPADLPPITEDASAWQGCLSEGDIPELSAELGIEEYHLADLLHQAGLPNNGCTPYVAATGGMENSALAMFQTDERLKVETPVLVIHKTVDGVTVDREMCECEPASSRVLELAVAETGKLPEEALADVPVHIRWQAENLVPSMLGELDATDYRVRMVLANATETEPEHLRSLEVIEASTGNRVDGAWWLARPDGPGVLIGMKGLEYEQILWQSPIDYVRRSRGLGPKTSTVKRKQKDGSVRVVTVQNGRYHYGVDMTAPKGTDVHVVADGVVKFAGRNGAFGNLIMVDHGHGYVTYYAHLSKILPGIKPGVRVPRGELIGLVGSTGRSTAPHLHFEVRQNNKYIDPLDGSHQLDFWLLSADDQVQLAKQILAPADLDTVLAAAGVAGIRAIQ